MHYAIFLEIGSGCLGNGRKTLELGLSENRSSPKFDSESPCSLYPHGNVPYPHGNLMQFGGIPQFQTNPEWHPCCGQVVCPGAILATWPRCLEASQLLLCSWVIETDLANVNWSNSCWFMMGKPTNVGDMGISAVFLSTRQELRAPWALSLDEFTWSLNGWKSGVQLEPIISIECHPIEASVTDTLWLLWRDQTLSNLIWRVKKSHISAGFEMSQAFRAWQGTLPALALGRMILGTLRMGQTREPSNWIFQWWIYSLSADTWIIFSHVSYS